MKIVVATQKPFDIKAVKPIRALFEEAGFECHFLERYQEKQELIDALQGVDALLVRSDKVEADVIQNSPDLKIIVRAGSGYDNIDCVAATENNVVVMNTPGQNANAVAELTIAYVLMGLRGCFDASVGHELYKNKLGLLGFGAIPKAVIRRAKGFDLDVVAYSRSLTPEEAQEFDATCAQSEADLFQQCPIVSLHIPSNEQTRESIDYKLLIQMPQNAILINTARADIIKEEDLFRVMKERDDFIYVSDVPPKARDEFETVFNSRVFFSPKKLGAQTIEANVNAGLAGAEQIIGYFLRDEKAHQLN